MLTTLAFPVDAVGAIENSEDDTIELFLSVNVSENHRSGCMVHSIGVFVINVIGSVTAPLKLQIRYVRIALLEMIYILLIISFLHRLYLR